MPGNSQTARIQLPEDWWHTYVYVNFSWLYCEKCKVEPKLDWVWDKVTANGEEGAAQFTVRAVKHLKDSGWTIGEYGLHCPTCAAK
jgi:hypothetical protein